MLPVPSTGTYYKDVSLPPTVLFPRALLVRQLIHPSNHETKMPKAIIVGLAEKKITIDIDSPSPSLRVTLVDRDKDCQLLMKIVIQAYGLFDCR